MKALILNSGRGSRMDELTDDKPKCMTAISETETILSRQLKVLSKSGIRKVVMTTGYLEDELKSYCESIKCDLEIEYVYNPKYLKTNYIYSMYLAIDNVKQEDIILMHGDLVFDENMILDMISTEKSCIKVSTAKPLPQKDFKAVVKNGKVKKIGVEYTEDAVEAQPLYYLKNSEARKWLDIIFDFCGAGRTDCYAETALNEIAEEIDLFPFDAKERLCSEIDNKNDLAAIKALLMKEKRPIVYMCFSADMIHSGHIKILKRAEMLGDLTVGVLSDEAVASYKRFPLIPYEERKILFENIKGVSRVVEQKTLSYAGVLHELKPDIVVHGDDWKTGFQKPIREEVISVLNEYGGRLKEFPYSHDRKFDELERTARQQLSMPDYRRGRLKKLLEMKGCVNAIEAHSGITGLIAEKTMILQDGKTYQFDAMWVSSLCDSTAKGKPDIELVDMTSRYRTIDDIMEVTTKPIIFDGDTGGLSEHFVYTVRSLERIGVSMVIIEDKCGLKKNSLFGTEVEQTQEDIEVFCEKIRAGKSAQKTHDFMICARIESLILEKGQEDALRRAFAFRDAGADAIMIHSRKKEPEEIISFVKAFRKVDRYTPLVVVPTSFNEVYEEELKDIGVNVIIYANHLTRSGIPAMKRAAETILANHRAKECDEICMPIKDIITLIPEEI